MPHAAAYSFKDVPEKPEKRKKPEALERMEYSRSTNGGHIMRHFFESGPGMGYRKPEEYTFGPSEGDNVLAHFAKCAGIKGHEGEDGEKEHKG